jgi:hypothetical protein
VALREVAEGGDMRATLEALRDRLAEEVERVADEGFCPACKRGSSSVAPVAGQLNKVLHDIAALPAPEKGTALDELKQRRSRRSSAS